MALVDKFIFFIYIIMGFGITIVYSLAVYWNLKLVAETEWIGYRSALKVTTSVVGLLFLFVYIYLLSSELKLFKIPEFLEIFVIRPLIFLNGATLASGARLAYNLFKGGGEKWMARKLKK